MRIDHGNYNGSVNWKEIDTIVQELSLENSFLREIKQPNYQTLIFKCRNKTANQDFMISLTPGKTCLLPINHSIKALPKPPRFTTLLKSRIKNGKILNCEQIKADRIVLLTIRKGNLFKLYIKLWNNAANLILCDESDQIIDAFSRRPKRNEVPGAIFIIPQPKSMPPPAGLSPDYPGESNYGNFLAERFFREQDQVQCQKVKSRLLQLISRQINQWERQLEKQENRENPTDEIARLRSYGDHIMALLHTIKKGDTFLSCPHMDNSEIQINIPLDPKLTPSENGALWYKKASNTEKRSKLAAGKKKKLQKEIKTLYRQKEKAEAETNIEALSLLLKERKQEQPRKKERKQTPGMRYEFKEGIILIGRSSAENEALFRHHTRGNDYWIHTRDYPGSHVYLRPSSGKIPDTRLLTVGTQLALLYSKARPRGEADLYYTQVKYLRKPSGGKPGTLIPTQEKNLYVKEDMNIIKSLEKHKL